MTGRRFRGCARSTPTSIGCSSAAPGRSSSWRRCCGPRPSAPRRAVLLVVGPSGCGKSSLVRAGLLPVMAGEPGWQTVPAILPGTQPVAALTRELAAAARQCGLGWSTAEIRRRLDDGGLAELANDLLLAGPGPRRTHLLIVVDQFEELLTQAAPAERARFAGLLGPALAGPVQVVGTLRPEFLDQLLAEPGAGRPAHAGARAAAAAPRGAARGDRGPGAAGRHRRRRGPGGAAGRRHRQRGGVAAAGLHPGPAGRRGGARRSAAGQPL